MKSSVWTSAEVRHDSFMLQDYNRTESWSKIHLISSTISSSSVQQLWRDSPNSGYWISVLLSFNLCTMKSRRTSWSQTDAFIVQDWNRRTEIQYPLLGHFFTAVVLKLKKSTFQGIILVLLSFNISTYRSHGEPAGQHDAFIVQDSNQCTEIQYPLLGHFFNFSTSAWRDSLQSRDFSPTFIQYIQHTESHGEPAGSPMTSVCWI